MSSNSFKILLIGAGQLGSRYLQGLVNCDIPLKIFVTDPNENSLVIAQTRWDEVVNSNSPHTLQFSQTLEGLPAEVDLCLVPTTADVRLSVVEQVLSIACVHYWILEKVLAQSEEQIDRLENILSTAEGVWVNTPRRAFSWHQQIYKQLPKGITWEIDGRDGAWGMACNSIHLIDLIAWWTGEELVSLDTSGLKNWFPSKRERFWEVNGKLKVDFSGGSKMELVAGEGRSNFSLNLKNKKGTWRLEESNGSFISTDGFSLPGKVEFQSEITGSLVEQILCQGKCPLPPLAESAKMHRKLIDALLEHWNVDHQSTKTVLPIT